MYLATKMLRLINLCELLPYCPSSLVGKTESTKMTIAQLARMSKSQEPTKLAEQIVEVGSFTN